jgi:hypothetical protein
VELYVTVSLANATKTYDERIEAFVERLRHDAEAICKGEFAFIKPVICLEVPEGTSPLDDDDFAPTQIEVEAAVVQWGLPVEAAKERLHEFVKWSPRDYLTKYGTEQSDEKFDNPSAGTAQLPLAS